MIGQRIKEERLRAGLSQERLAFCVGITVNTQIKYERDGTVRAPTLQRYAAMLMDVQYIATGCRSTSDAHAAAAALQECTAQGISVVVP